MTFYGDRPQGIDYAGRGSVRRFLNTTFVSWYAHDAEDGLLYLYDPNNNLYPIYVGT